MAGNTTRKYNYQYGSSARAYAEEPLRQPLPTKEPEKKGKVKPRKRLDKALVMQHLGQAKMNLLNLKVE